MTDKPAVAAIEGWFTLDSDAPRLLGTRCERCGTYYFPKNETYCRNPDCDSTDLTEVPLSRRGRIWSYTNACYQPPEPYRPRTESFQPFALAAVELEAERMIVMGQVVEGVDVDQLQVGQEVELVVETLYEDDESRKLIWKWQPLG